MDFVFPKDKVVFQGVLKEIDETSSKPGFYRSVDISRPERNLVNINGVEYVFTYLSEESESGPGGNSIILKLFLNNEIYDDDGVLDYQEPSCILKICKNPIIRGRRKNIHNRFIKEIDALKECLSAKFQNVVKIFDSGQCKIFNPDFAQYDVYLYYTMEYAKYSLKTFVEIKHLSLSLDEKVGLCLSLCQGLNELESHGFYHRDIKPENIFMVETGGWKIGDLGLIYDRKLVTSIDRRNEAIGPKGWMTPESMNKYLCENKGFIHSHDSSIDHQSDIFQLGKVFWYIFQYNAPIGTVRESDFFIRNSSLYSICKTMLNYSKKRRFKHVAEIIKLLKPIEIKILKRAV